MNAQKATLGLEHQVAGQEAVDQRREADDKYRVGQDTSLVLSSSRSCAHQAEASLHHEHEDKANHAPRKRDTSTDRLKKFEDLDAAVALGHDFL